jgi:hypothetical protein
VKRAFALGAVVVVAALAVVATSVPAGAHGVRKRCPAGTVRARIGGATRCLRAGKPCRSDWDAKYHRYGFHCIDGRLVRATRKQRLAAAPSDCPGIAPIVQSQAPAPYGALFGSAPLWAGIYSTSFDSATNAFHARYGSYHRTRYGWPLKILWVTSRMQSDPVSLSIVRLVSGAHVLLGIDGQDRDNPHVATLTTSPLLDPSFPGHPDVEDRPLTHEWGSTVYFPRAACYHLDASWPGGGWHFTFAFGR